MPQALDFGSNIYLSVTLSSGSPFFSTPSSLTDVHSSLTYQGQVGALSDVQLYSAPKPNWDTIQEEVLSALRGREGVVRVDTVQEPRRRSKRDEL